MRRRYIPHCAASREMSDNVRLCSCDLSPQRILHSHTTNRLPYPGRLTQTEGERVTELPTEAASICTRFAARHKLIFDQEGVCGYLLHECVGFRDGRHWVDHNPVRRDGTDEPIADLACPAALPPADVPAYAEHRCLCVFGRGPAAVAALARWVIQMENAGDVSVVDYKTGATGAAAVVHGFLGRAVIIS